jgi:hypothetical protein
MPSREYEEWWAKVANTPHMVWCLRVASIGVLPTPELRAGGGV